MTTVSEQRLWRRSEVHRLVGSNASAVCDWERKGLFCSTIPPRGSGTRAFLDRQALGGLAVLAALKNSGISFDGDELPSWDDLCSIACQGGSWFWLPNSRHPLRWPICPSIRSEVGVLIDVDDIIASLERRLADVG